VKRKYDGSPTSIHSSYRMAGIKSYARTLQLLLPIFLSIFSSLSPSILSSTTTTAFVSQMPTRHQIATPYRYDTSSRVPIHPMTIICQMSTQKEEEQVDNITSNNEGEVEEDDDDSDNIDDLFTISWKSEEDPEEERNKYPTLNRWQSLDPKIKEKIIQEQGLKAKAKKSKFVSKNDKKRQLMMQYKKSQIIKKRESRIQRPLVANSTDRILLSDLQPNTILTNGTVISLKSYGVYVDVGSQVDGLLHVSQISRAENMTFVAHPREVFSPGDVVENLYVHRVSSELRKLQLSLLPPEQRGILPRRKVDSRNDEHGDGENDEDDVDRIPLNDIGLDDELWGIIERVTNYGAYVELGAVVKGFLHFMDHPYFGTDKYKGAHPSEYMKLGQRVRVWVSQVDMEKERIKLTALRPESLPILRRGLRF